MVGPRCPPDHLGLSIMTDPYEYCCECNCTTGRAGKADDSLYAGDYGPLCEECYDALIEAAPKWKRQRDNLLSAVRMAHEAMRADDWHKLGHEVVCPDDRLQDAYEAVNGTLLECEKDSP